MGFIIYVICILCKLDSKNLYIALQGNHLENQHWPACLNSGLCSWFFFVSFFNLILSLTFNGSHYTPHKIQIPYQGLNDPTWSAPCLSLQHPFLSFCPSTTLLLNHNGLPLILRMYQSFFPNSVPLTSYSSAWNTSLQALLVTSFFWLRMTTPSTRDTLHHYPLSQHPVSFFHIIFMFCLLICLLSFPIRMSISVTVLSPATRTVSAHNRPSINNKYRMPLFKGTLTALYKERNN